MKISSTPPKFPEVTIVLEDKHEVEFLYAIICFAIQLDNDIVSFLTKKLSWYGGYGFMDFVEPLRRQLKQVIDLYKEVE